MRRPSLTKARIALLAVGLAATAATPAAERLASQAPPGVDLTGRWELDAARSDDPARVRAAWQRALPKPKPRDHTAGAEPAAARIADWNGAGPASTPLGGFLAAIDNPPVLELRSDGTDLDLPRADGSVACTPGDVVAVMDRHGDSERRCGWRGNALVVAQDVKRGPRREDRYELAPDGTLAWSTAVTAKKSPPLVVHRVYRRGGADTAASVAAPPRGVPAN